MGKLNYTTAKINEFFASFINKIIDTSSLTADNDHVPTSSVVKSALNGKQDTLTIDTSTLSNDSTHVPASSVVKSALTSETDVAVTAATGTTINKHSVKNGIVTISGQTTALTGGGDNTLATITDSSCLNSDLYFSALSVSFTSRSDTAKLIGNSGIFMSDGIIQIRITDALTSGFKWLVQYQL